MTQRKIALSIEEAADYTGIGRNTLRKLVEWKKLPVLKVGRKVLIKTDMLELFMEANEGGLHIPAPFSFPLRRPGCPLPPSSGLLLEMPVGNIQSDTHTSIRTRSLIGAC